MTWGVRLLGVIQWTTQPWCDYSLASGFIEFDSISPRLNITSPRCYGLCYYAAADIELRDHRCELHRSESHAGLKRPLQ